MIVYGREEGSRWGGGEPIKEGGEVRERQEIATIPDVERISTRANAGQARIEVNFDWDVNIDVKRMEVREAVERARRGDGPTLIECKTMRMLGHAAHDDARYVPRELLDEWEKKDPTQRYEKVLGDQGLLTPEIREQIEARVTADLEDAQAFAIQSPMPDPNDLEKGVYHGPECYWDQDPDKVR